MRSHLAPPPSPKAKGNHDATRKMRAPAPPRRRRLAPHPRRRRQGDHAVAPALSRDGDAGMNLAINPLIGLAVFASTAVTDAAYVFFNAAVAARHRVRAANWSAVWYLLSAFAVISY